MSRDALNDGFCDLQATPDVPVKEISETPTGRIDSGFGS